MECTEENQQKKKFKNIMAVMMCIIQFNHKTRVHKLWTQKYALEFPQPQRCVMESKKINQMELFFMHFKSVDAFMRF